MTNKYPIKSCSCGSSHAAGSVEITKSNGAWVAKHGSTVAATGSCVAVTRPARRSSYGRGKWTGCSCGSREMADGSVSANACSQCRYDAE